MITINSKVLPRLMTVFGKIWSNVNKEFINKIGRIIYINGVTSGSVFQVYRFSVFVIIREYFLYVFPEFLLIIRVNLKLFPYIFCLGLP